ncbi:HD-GYP domain-containing protein [Pseudalkalibacillus sp. Hm43]|uniref:HD-GYP domain-containing protein n=1 Tax=Pseudalkalibacillus sp. Hm43 TaxID=3450742 RepID=UPI003F41F5FD
MENNNDLHEGICLASNVYSKKGILLLKQGTVLTQAQIDMLDKHEWFYEGEPLPSVGRSSEIIPATIINSDDPPIQQAYDQAVTSIKKLFTNIQTNLKNKVNIVFNQFSSVLEEVLEDEDQAISLIYDVKDHDEVTYRHSMNVGLVAGVIGKVLKLPEEQIFLLGKMGILHDIGKTKIKNDILKKPERLSDEEYETIKLHTRYGYEILSEIPNLNPLVAIGALAHHERLDGTGYPDGRTADDLPYLVQILAVADIYDAICTERDYHEGRSSFVAIEQLVKEAEMGRLNQAVVKEFVRYLMKQYVGRNVLLNSQKNAVITFIPYEQPHRPLLKIGSEFLDLKKVPNVSIKDFAH